MQSLVVCFSKFGNTRTLAEEITETFQSAGPTRLVSVDQLTVSDLKEADLVVMGTPTHNMNLPKAVRPLLERLPKRVLRGVPVAAFDTSYRMSWLMNQFTASKRLSRKLRKLGGKRVVPPEIFHVTGREGPLFEGEIGRARKWASTILTTVNNK